MSLSGSVITRWDAASLDSSIAILYRANPAMDEFGATPEDLNTKNLPRAEFYIEDDSPEVETTAYRLRRAILTFRVYHTSSATLETLLDSIETNFDNAENASTSPMTIDASQGKLICVEYEGPREIHPIDEGISLGMISFKITWQKARTTPG